MLRRFERIKDCGIFEDFRWDASLPELARINVIFGCNGTGKTSLAGALDGLRHPPGGEGYQRISLAVEDTSGARTTGFNDDAIFDRVHVFSEHYVDRSHRFSPAAADMDAVLTIGERPVDAENRLEELREKVTAKTAQLDAASQAQADAERAVDSAFRRISQEVVDMASRAGGRWHSKSNFSTRVVRTAFGGSHDVWAELTEDALRDYASVINSDKLEALPENDFTAAVPNGLDARLSAALSATPTSIVLDTLAAHPEATSWVDSGRHLHSGVDNCIFCGSGLTEERKSMIEKHFSDEVERLQATLETIARELDQVLLGIDRASNTIPAKGLFYEDLRPRADVAAMSLRSELSALKEWVEIAKGRVKAKAANVLGVVDSSVQSPPNAPGADLLALRREHNSRAEGHEALVNQAAVAIERHYLKKSEATVSEQSVLAETKRAETTHLESELEVCRDQIATLENVEGDPMPTAKVLTEEVARLLGRSELKFESVDGRYRVSRFGVPAIGLSVGERTAITLVHFLESVARFDPSRGKPIVVIDDPVSSLDSDIFMGVSTYIWAEAIVKPHIDQLILLTHNFELFRQWDIQLDGLHQSRGRDPATQLTFREQYPARLFEIRSRHVTRGGRTKRQPVLAPWPPSEQSRRKVRSTYHHAFICVASALQNLNEDDSLENRLDAQLLFPNVIRRMLETFLAFKRPEWVGDFNGAMRKSADILTSSGYNGDPNALRLRLTRYAHAHSHDEDPTTDKTVSPEEIATAIASVFEFMNQIDEGHFSGLCTVVGIMPSELLPPPPPELQQESEPVMT